MATVTITPDHIAITFTTAEKLGGLLRDQRIPRSSVVAVDVVPDGYAATSGLRSPGLGIPGRRKIGTWRSRGRKHLVSVRRGEPALRISARGQRYDDFIVGTSDAAVVGASLT